MYVYVCIYMICVCGILQACVRACVRACVCVCVCGLLLNMKDLIIPVQKQQGAAGNAPGLLPTKTSEVFGGIP